jgi:hypothetical protein
MTPRRTMFANMRKHRAAGTRALLLTALLALASAPAASAAEIASRSFTTTGESELVVPAGVTSMQVKLVGGAGSPADGNGPLGGAGALVTATIAVTPGETLFAEVGGYAGVTSPDFPVEATNGGGAYGGNYAGAGGGATDVRTCSSTPGNPLDQLACTGEQTLQTRLLVAGGGGGGGGDSNEPGIRGGIGGNAGSPGAGGDAYEEFELEGGGGGAAATQGAAGSAGDHSTPHGTQASAGQLGRGGNGGGDESGDYATAGGGGGGGGIFGGGGGGSGESEYGGSPEAGGGGGGGGSSGVPAGVSGVSAVTIATASHAAIPEALFTWTRPAPSVASAAASTVSANAATLAGSVNPNGSQVTDCHFQIAPAPPGGNSLVPCEQQVGAGSTPVVVSALASGLSPATTYTFTLMATSAQGASSGSPVTFVTLATSGPGSGTGVGVGVGPLGTGPLGGALSVTNLKLTPTRFHRGTRPATIARQPKKKAKALPISTTISFVLSSSATVKLGFELAQPGVLVEHKCSVVSKTHRKDKRCVRYKAVHGGVTRAGHAGTDKITFAGVLDGGVRLAPGTYRLSLGATGPAGSATAAQHPSFTLLG